jgi:riboflavin kinase/FMN adenylyltransferase
MELIRGLHNLRPRHHGCVATIGNFDGVHLGHQHVLGELAQKAAALKVPAVVITFEPQPQEWFRPQECPARLTRFREKILALRRLAVDRVLVLSFTQKLASMAPAEFVQQVLVDGLGIQHLVVGDDFRFGAKRAGDFAYLQQAGTEFGFSVENMRSFEVEGARVSSTGIRDALAVGDLQAAARLLGRPYRMNGRVAHGDKKGRTIGFPTANIHLHRKVSPIRGVFAVEVYGIPGEPVAGVANVGTRPTVGGTRLQLEVHLFDFNAEIYGHHVSVDFLQRIRDEQRFDSFDLLRQQIDRDAQQAREFFASRAS